MKYGVMLNEVGGIDLMARDDSVVFTKHVTEISAGEAAAHLNDLEALHVRRTIEFDNRDQSYGELAALIDHDPTNPDGM